MVLRKIKIPLFLELLGLHDKNMVGEIFNTTKQHFSCAKYFVLAKQVKHLDQRGNEEGEELIE